MVCPFAECGDNIAKAMSREDTVARVRRIGARYEGEVMRRHVVIMGVLSCGKSTVGELLAQRTGLPFRDGDDMHPAANIEKMAAGHALDDDDRTPWLESIGRFLAAQESGAIVGCSALKRSYRDLIRAAAPETVFIHLHGSYDLLKGRMGNRTVYALVPARFAVRHPRGARPG